MQTKSLYKYSQSPLYKLQSKKKLADILQISTAEIDRLVQLLESREHMYSVFKVGEKKREIQHPRHPLLIKTQNRVFTLLKRFELPDYVFSGKKGCSYISNAIIHKDSDYFLTMDIEHFYASTKSEYVFQFFFHKMKMASDLAHVLTNICTYRDFENNNQKIPTGSKLSQLLSYWSYSDMFDSIAELARDSRFTFSLYVDDMTFSSKTPIPNDFHKKVEEILRNKRLRFKRSKVRYYGKNQVKKVTGIIVTPCHQIDIPKSRIKDTVESIGKALAPSATIKDKQSAFGKIKNIQQIKTNTFSNVEKQIL